MSCCGNRHTGQQTRTVPSSGPASNASESAPSDPVFEYLGASALTLTGPITGRTYCFEHRGARMPVNRHDAPSLLYIPNLKPVLQR